MRTRVPRKFRGSSPSQPLGSGAHYAITTGFFEGGLVVVNCMAGVAIPAGNWVSFQLTIDDGGYGGGAADYPAGTNMQLIWTESFYIARGFHKLTIVCLGFSANGTMNTAILDAIEMG